jgi:hypothetical protein
MSQEENPHLTYYDFAGAVGESLGYGWGEANGDRAWTAKQLRNIKAAVASGQRMVYYPIPLPGESAAHSWSFLRPTSELTLADGTTEILLPMGCGSQVEGVITYQATGKFAWQTLRLTNWATIRHHNQQYPSATGAPLMVAIEPLKMTQSSAGGPQRFRLIVSPQADAEYTLRLTYQVIPEMISADRPYHYGGAQHTETFLAACKAAAEIARDNIHDGPYKRDFVERLIASVHLDRRSRPQTLGYNGDASDLRWQQRGMPGDRRFWQGPLVTIGGLTPE